KAPVVELVGVSAERWRVRGIVEVAINAQIRSVKAEAFDLSRIPLDVGGVENHVVAVRLAPIDTGADDQHIILVAVGGELIVSLVPAHAGVLDAAGDAEVGGADANRAGAAGIGEVGVV